MRNARRALAVGLSVVALCVGVLVLRAAIRASAASAPAAARLAVVLVPGATKSELVVVDLDTAKVVRRVGLRSLVTDIDADPVRGTVVAAQTGGIGGLADDAVSFTDPRTGGVRYVTLPTIDPSQVRCIAGRAVVLHAVVDAGGFAVSALDLDSESVVATGHAPDGTGMWSSAGGSLWTVASTDATSGLAPARVDPRTLASTRVASVGFTPVAALAVGTAVALIGSSRESGAPGDIALVDSHTGELRNRVSVPGLAHGPQCGVEVGGSLVIGDWNGEMPEDPTLAVLDPTTLAVERRISVGTAPCALGAAGADLLVVDRVEGALRAVDPSTGITLWRVDLGARDLLCSRVVVVPPR